MKQKKVAILIECTAGQRKAWAAAAKACREPRAAFIRRAVEAAVRGVLGAR